MFAAPALLYAAYGAMNVPRTGDAWPGLIALPGAVPERNAHISRDLSEFAWTNEFAPSPFARPGGAGLFGTPGARVADVPGERPGFIARSFHEDWYDHIHLRPARVDLADLVWPNGLPVTIWNAWFVPRDIVEISGLGSDFILNLDAPPGPLPPLAEKTVQIGAAPNSRAIIETDIVFRFDNDETVRLIATINRAIVWGWPPDWSNSVRERLEWATDILASESMLEQRRALRAAPRRSFDATFIVEGRARQYLDLALFSWGANDWTIPIWADVQWLAQPVAAGAMRIACRTDGIEFRAGGLAVLIGETPLDAETLEIDAVTAEGINLKRAVQNSKPAGTRLYPALFARLSGDPTLTRKTDALYTLDASFIVVQTAIDTAAAPVATYRGRPVLETRPDETDDLTRAYERLIQTLDTGLSFRALVTNTGERAMPITAWRWLGHGRAEQAAFRTLIHWLAGRQRAVWTPSWADDLTAAGIQGNALEVLWAGYTRFVRLQPGRRDIRIDLADGTALYRRILDAQEISNERETLYLDDALGNIQPEQIARISWMSLSRGDSDTIEIEHITDSDGVARSEIIFRGVRDDEF
jgi:hypothetical protein